mgnify:CR=1 FL=1
MEKIVEGIWPVHFFQPYVMSVVRLRLSAIERVASLSQNNLFHRSL